MKINKLIPTHIGDFVKTYIANYTNEEGVEKNYEIVSRKKLEDISDLSKKKSDAVTIIAFSQDKEKILLQKEFRMAINDWVWSFPAGLIDNGEDPAETAKRELFEETGLTLVDILYKQPPCYTSVGLTNEMSIPIYCTATGTIAKSDSAMEEIEAYWFTKKEVIKLLSDIENSIEENKPYIGLTNRCAAVLYNWCGII